MSTLKRVAIIGGKRIPFSRSFGPYFGVNNKELMSASVKALVEEYKLTDKAVGEVVLGAVMKHSKDWNLAREVTLESGLSASTPAYDIQQACGTSLEAAILVANKIALGQIDCAIAGGVDTNSDLPIVFSTKFSHRLLKSSRGRSFSQKIKPFLGMGFKELKPVVPGVTEPRTKLSMGQHCERMAQEWQIPRLEQDKLAIKSHHNAAKAYDDGFFKDMVINFKGINKDNNVRPQTNLESMSKLKPAFDKTEKATLTAGNSSPLTDGSACVLLGSEEWAKANNLPILAYLTLSQCAAVDFVEGEGLLMAPAYAVSELLKKANLQLQDFDYYEIHEAFAAQVLCTLKAWESDEFCKNKLGREKALGTIDKDKINVTGSSVSIGHPFAATGARIIHTLSKLLNQKGQGRGLISICTAGGMGVTAIIEKN